MLEIELENIIEMTMKTDHIVSVKARATDHDEEQEQGQDKNIIDRIIEDIWPDNAGTVTARTLLIA